MTSFPPGQRRAATGEAARRRRHDAHRRGNTERARTEYCTEFLTREGSIKRCLARSLDDLAEVPDESAGRPGQVFQAHFDEPHSRPPRRRMATPPHPDERRAKPASDHDGRRYARDPNGHDEQISTLTSVDIVAVTRSGRGDRLNRFVATVASGAHPFTVGRRCDSCHSGRPIPKPDPRQGSWAATTPDSFTTERTAMNRTYRVTEIVGTSSDGLDAAVGNGIARAAATLVTSTGSR